MCCDCRVPDIFLRRWFVVGSVCFAVTSLMVLLNSFQEEEYLGADDSVLSRFRYRATWLLMVVSGFFCTLGASMPRCLSALS